MPTECRSRSANAFSPGPTVRPHTAGGTHGWAGDQDCGQLCSIGTTPEALTSKTATGKKCPTLWRPRPTWDHSGPNRTMCRNLGSSPIFSDTCYIRPCNNHYGPHTTLIYMCLPRLFGQKLSKFSVFSSTYHVVVTGYSGSLHQNRIFGQFLGTSCHITVTQVGCCYNGSLDQNRNFLAVFSIVPRSGTVRSQNWSQVNTSCPKWCHFTVLGFSSTSWRYWWLQRLPALKRDDFRCHWAHSATFWSREGSELVPS